MEDLGGLQPGHTFLFNKQGGGDTAAATAALSLGPLCATCAGLTGPSVRVDWTVSPLTPGLTRRHQKRLFLAEVTPNRNPLASCKVPWVKPLRWSTVSKEGVSSELLHTWVVFNS